MFRKKCPECGKKIGRNFSFCPYCGSDAARANKEKEEKDFGFIGKDDFPKFDIKMPFGFNRLFGSLLKEVDKQFRELDKQIGQDTKREKIEKQKLPFKFPFKQSGGIGISISSATGREPVIKVKKFGNVPGFAELEKRIGMPKEMKEEIRQGREGKTKKIEISEEEAEKISKLPRQEAETKVRRLANKIVYEIDLPGVKSIKEIIINRLENSIEIKAFSKDKVFFKLLPINLPIIRHMLKNGKLILELEPEE